MKTGNTFVRKNRLFGLLCILIAILAMTAITGCLEDRPKCSAGYPNQCENDKCCPPGFTVSCGGLCYKTVNSANSDGCYAVLGCTEQ